MWVCEMAATSLLDGVVLTKMNAAQSGEEYQSM